jgi:hypothetical protein
MVFSGTVFWAEAATQSISAAQSVAIRMNEQVWVNDMARMKKY